jgi:hypothetical protein
MDSVSHHYAVIRMYDEVFKDRPTDLTIARLIVNELMVHDEIRLMLDQGGDLSRHALESFIGREVSQTDWNALQVTWLRARVEAERMLLGDPLCDRGRAKPRSFPRIWELMGYMLPPKAHDRLWIPAIEDEKRKYYEARRRYRTRAARVWLKVAFTVRTLLMVPDCYRVMGVSKLQGLFETLIPEPLRRWWLGL